MELSDTAVLNLRGKQLERLLHHTAMECALGLAGIGVAVLALSRNLPMPVALVWASLLALTHALRVGVLMSFRRANSEAQLGAGWHIAFAVTVGATALGWGAMSAWVAATHGVVASAPMLLLAAAIMLLSITMQVGSLPCAIASIAGTLLPPASALALGGGYDGFLPALALAFAGVSAFLGARVLREKAWDAAMRQAENEHLRDYLDQRRDQIEKLAVELKTTQGKRDQAELTLRRSAADLGLVQGKAKALAETLERVSTIDQTTGLDNRRHFEQVLDAEWRRAARETKSISMVLVELDDFEKYTESHGRQSADTVLKRVAQLVRGFGRRPGDAVGRYDDTRLALLLSGCDARNATRIAEALRKRVEAQNIPHAGARGERNTLTVHAGVAMMKPTRSMQTAELVKRVEAALYEAHFQGGNRIMTYQPLSKLRLERWDQPADGPLSEQAMMQKLLVWGYDTSKQLLAPGASVEPRILEHELVVAALTGELRIEVEGHSMALKAGDCIVIPAGVELSMEVLGPKPVVKLTASRNK
jgi:diguanylate cyclase (GGDEF)-like protein